MLEVGEAEGLLEVVKNYLLQQQGDLPAPERRGIGRLLSEIQYTLEHDKASQGRDGTIKLVK